MEEWIGERKRRWKLLDILKERKDEQNDADKDLGSYLAALFGWDDEALKECEEEEKRRQELTRMMMESWGSKDKQAT